MAVVSKMVENFIISSPRFENGPVVILRANLADPA
jgi:hypothetical protein